MALILNLETTSHICSVALGKGKSVVAAKEIEAPRSHSKNIIPFIEEVMEKSSYEREELSAITISKGPGSYTGLRIGASVAKGLCYTLDLPLISLSTLKSMAAGLIHRLQQEDWFDQQNLRSHQVCFAPVLPARKQEVFTAVYDVKLNTLQAPAPTTLNVKSFEKIRRQYTLVILGNNLTMAQATFKEDGSVIFYENFSPSAQYMVPLAYEKYRSKDFEDVAYFEPSYLKDFIVN